MDGAPVNALIFARRLNDLFLNMKKTPYAFLLPALLAFAPLRPLPAQVRINEYSCANLDQFPDEFGKHEDWIELYNMSADSADISGYYLSDNTSKPKKWAFPAGTKIAGKGYLIAWASGRDIAAPSGFHTNFKLTQTKSNPETILLANAAGTVLDQIKVNKTQLWQSRGRITDGGPDWGILTQPTPQAPNQNAPHYLSYADRPDFSAPAGFYTDSVTVALTNNAPGATLYYTLDGSEPSSASTPYTQPLTLKTTTVLKAMALSPDATVHPGFVEYATYFINANHTLPVVSIAGNQLKSLANGNQDLRPFGSMEYFNANGERSTRAYGEFNRHGQDSWVNNQRSIDLIARDEMGYNNALKEKIFALSDRAEFQRLILRAAGDDNYPGNFLPAHKGCAHLRDAYVHNLAKRGNLHLDVRLSEKAIVYIDGKYWGVYDLREIPDDHDYTEYYYGQGKYDLQYILTWGNTWAEYGGDQAIAEWNSLYAYIMSHYMGNQAYFNHVDSLLDVKSLVDYVLVNSLTVCSDWLNYNTGWWRGLNPAGEHKKWGYILWDNDATFGYYINYTNIPDTSATALPCNPESLDGFSDPEGHIKVLRRLLANAEFEQYYISRYIDLMNTVFGCENMLAYLDTVASRIAPEMAEHTARWGGSAADWQKNVERLRFFITRRCQAIPAGLSECYGLTGPYEVTFDVDPDSAGALQINSLRIDRFPYTGAYFGNVELKLAALQDTATGYRFDRWVTGRHAVLPDDSTRLVHFLPTGADTITARFVQVTTAVANPGAQVNGFSIAVHPTPCRENAELTLELPVQAPVSLRLFALDGREAAVLAGGGQIREPGQYVLRLDLAGSGLPAGMYVLQCEAGAFRRSVRVVYAP